MIFTYKRAQNTHSCQSTLVLFGVFKNSFLAEMQPKKGDNTFKKTKFKSYKQIWDLSYQMLSRVKMLC